MTSILVTLTWRFVEAPVAPSAIVTVPVAGVPLAEVELVKDANVPRPPTLAAAPTMATDKSSFCQSERCRVVRMLVMSRSFGVRPPGSRRQRYRPVVSPV